MASRRLHLGIVQAILALFLFAGIPGFAGWHGGSIAPLAIAATNDENSGDPGNDLDGRLDLFTEMSHAIGGDEPSGGPDDGGASKVETDGDSGEDGAATAWTALGWPFDEGLSFPHARVATKRGLSTAHGATGPPPGTCRAEQAA